MVRTHRGQRGDPLYTSERYQKILQMVVNSGIIGELQHNPGYVASFFGRIQHDAIAIARRIDPILLGGGTILSHIKKIFQ